MQEPISILSVNKNQSNLKLLAQLLGENGFQSLNVSSLEDFDQAVAGAKKIALALVDITDFDRSIWERCELLRTQSIPLIVVSPKQSASIRQESLAHGADSLLVKPLITRELLGLIRHLLAS